MKTGVTDISRCVEFDVRPEEDEGVLRFFLLRNGELPGMEFAHVNIKEDSPYEMRVHGPQGPPTRVSGNVVSLYGLLKDALRERNVRSFSCHRVNVLGFSHPERASHLPKEIYFRAGGFYRHPEQDIPA